MKKIITPILKWIIDKVKRNKFVQDVFESPIDLNKYESFDVFVDETGYEHKLYKNLRSKIKPGWERMLSNKKREASDVNITTLKTNSFLEASKLDSILKMYGKTIKGADIVEIGCHSGANSFAMAELGAKSVVGTEFNGYKVSSVSAESANNTSKLNEVNDFLDSLRNRLKGVYSIQNNIKFINDDICNSSLKPNSLDVICSWEVLEHLHNPEGAFKTISQVLKVGGISVQHYNPFFCLNGGHSLCTLDLLWGHARLSENDFKKYIKEIRPKEEKKAISFFTEGVNRMTLDDLNSILIESGMKILGVIPFVKEQHFRMVDTDILEQTQKLYPNLKVLDLIAPSVVVITQKVK